MLEIAARPVPREVAQAMTWDELEAAGLCDCGLPLQGHPPLRAGPGGRERRGPSRAFNPRTVLPAPGPPRRPDELTPRQREVLAVAWATPTRTEAGRRLRVTGQAIGEILATCARKGHAVPPIKR